MSYGRDYGPWHTLTVTAVADYEAIDGEDPDDVEYDLQFDHPADCAHHDECYTERDIREWHDMYDDLKASGTYRVRTWYTGPDHEGDYDGGIEREPVTEDGALCPASTSPAWRSARPRSGSPASPHGSRSC